MSEPPPNTTVPPPILTTPYPTPYHRQPQPQPQPQPQSHHHLPLREYRKGNWTLEETLILITAKRLDDERRINNAATPNASSSSRGATGELRWKWVENYCWSNGCLRSQNQCNDKWDNLLRDYKKVREYEVSLLSSSSASSSSSRGPSYWEMDKNQRKDRSLPSNLILRIYEALNEVVQRKYITSHQSATTSTSTRVPTTLSIQSPPPMSMLLPTLPLPSTLPPPPPPTVAVGNSGATDSSETEGTGDEDDQSPKLDPETKRRKMRDIESSIIQSTSVLAQTLMKCEEKREKRHREIMEKEEQRLRIEETRTEMNRQGMSSLITSVNNLSTAIHALISDRRDKG